ncbi:cell envelope-related function transcriptional attenuator common domain-containing protein [Micromonospora viridifaciens]|uniref:Cell envelope-related function transcriptional attenuator common domain-containing protein n=1 Tax=Micromonospora viridifaciens TaxID=1881 RepID=A0A1C4U8Q9_MICVI|nr:LCP family protein [Micromonospora viridifaciens]SCE68032.1 cell envelope-related function transcriptional attenuator common domain-containing protein [Micromonospora viridifaciens]
MIEDDLRAAFARHEELTPPSGPLRAAIDRAVVRRRRRRLGLRLAGTAMVVVAAALTGFTVAAPQHRESGHTLAEPAASAPAGALNVLLVGLDGNADRQVRFADSILLVHIPADRGRLYLVSLPRYLEVTVPGKGRQPLNAAFSVGAGQPRPDLDRGYRATRDAVADALGVRIDAGGVLTYPAVRELTNLIGGVQVCLPQRVHSAHSDRVFPAGCQQLDGAASVDLLRQRVGLPDGVLDRDRNAERYAAGLLHRLRERDTFTNPLVLNQLLQHLSSGVVADTGGSSLPALGLAAAKAATAEPVGLLPPGTHLEKSGDVRFELDPVLGPGFLDALRTDRLGEWITAHPAQATRLR